MAETIPPKLLELLMKRLGLSKPRVYALIAETASDNHLSRLLAVFLLASKNKINIQRFATSEQLAELRGVQRHHPVVPSSAPTKHDPPPRFAKPKPIKTTKNNSIFVVHGRDTKLNEDIFGFLRAIGINPKEWSQAIKDAKGANPNVGEVIHNAMKQVQGVLVVFSPDEEAKLRTKFCSDRDKKYGANKLEPQARPNVIFEAGLALGAHADKTLLVQVGDIREISDIAGKHILHLSDHPASRKELAQRLATKLKFKVDTSGTSWLSDSFKFNR
jgi:predicted nucleotide-binding protein